MANIDLQSIAANGFRVLGLSGSASQAAIAMAARRMRIWPEEGSIPPTPWDLEWLGPLSRRSTALHQAVARLSQPLTRMQDRLLWYAGAQTPFAETVPQGDAIAPSPPLARCHDAAVGALHCAIASDPLGEDIGPWREALHRFGGWCTSKYCVEWFLNVERTGDFDKPATGREIEEAIDSLPKAIAEWLTSAALAALGRGDEQSYDGAIAAVREFHSLAAGQALPGLSDRLEDQLYEGIAAINADLGSLRTNRYHPQPFVDDNFVVTQLAVSEYWRRVEPALSRLRALVQNDPARMDRVISAAADLLVLIALGWEWSGEWPTAAETLEVAARLTAGIPGNARILHKLEEVRAVAATVTPEPQVNRIDVYRAVASSTSQFLPAATRRRARW
jgi:hypothetical protein